jgi:hypothetical protein
VDDLTGFDRTLPSRRAVLALGSALLLAPHCAWGDSIKPRLGPDAVPVQDAPDYLRRHPAPDYWALSPYYDGQVTNSACSLATIAMLINALRGLPHAAATSLVTQHALLRAIADRKWGERTAEGGAGVTFDEFVQIIRRALEAYKIDAEIEPFVPRDASTETQERMRRILSDNERSAGDIVVAYFNQGVLTGDWDGPHTSPIGAYDAEERRVLIMDVDRQWYVPYWSPDEKFLQAMLRPAPAKEGSLAGETGGLVRVSKRP